MTAASFGWEVLDWIRLHFGGRPLLLSLVLASAVAAVLTLRPRTAIASQQLLRAVGIAGAAGLVAYVGMAAWYATTPLFSDHAEPTVPIVGWLFHLGQPIYHDIDSASRYAHVWGPLSFMIPGWILALAGPSLFVAKAIGSAAAIASVACLVIALRAEVSMARAVALAGLLTAMYLIFRNFTFWTRAEPLQLLCVSASLALVVRARGSLAAILIGVLSGVLWNLKFTGPLFSAPLCVLLTFRSRARYAVLAAAVGVVAAAAPFLAIEEVSLANYQRWVELSANTGLVFGTLRQNVEWACYLTAPLLLTYFAVPAARRPAGRAWRIAVITTVLCLLAATIPAAKPGAGPYHLLPFGPILMYLTAHVLKAGAAPEVNRRLASLASGLVLATLLLAMVFLGDFVRRMRLLDATTGGAAADLVAILDTHPGPITMGYGSPGSEATTFARPLLVFARGTYLLDAPAIREHQLAGIELPASTIEAVRTCAAGAILVPRDGEPFNQPNPYPGKYPMPMFSDAFRRAFAESYRLTSSTPHFNVYTCALRRTP